MYMYVIISIYMWLISCAICLYGLDTHAVHSIDLVKLRLISAKSHLRMSRRMGMYWMKMWKMMWIQMRMTKTFRYQVFFLCAYVCLLPNASLGMYFSCMVEV